MTGHWPATTVAFTALLVALGATDDEITDITQRAVGQIIPTHPPETLKFCRRLLNETRQAAP